VAQLITPRTRAVIVAHIFGHIADIEAIRRAAPGIPIVEDAVQGLGGYFRGKPVGALGDLSFVSFDKTKMIGGRGGALLLDDDALVKNVAADLRRLPDLPGLCLDALDDLLPPAAAAAYTSQLRTLAPVLLRRFDPSPANLDRIQTDWQTLGARVEARNAKASLLQTRLSGLPLTLPDVRAGDAIWRYTITAPTVAFARRMMHGLQLAGLNGSGLYYPLSRLFGQQTGAGALANRLVNLWVDEATSESDLRRAADVIAAVPWPRTFETGDSSLHPE
jgi:dTDP-4-amino-4,6-dideoxygalactose transaminase